MSRDNRLLLCLPILLLFAPAPSRAQGTATPVPPERWDQIEARAILDDATWFTGQQGEPNCTDPKRRIPFWYDVDVEGGYLFVAGGELIQIRDARTNRAAPPLVDKELCRPNIGGWIKNLDENWSLKTLDAPTNDPSVLLVGIGAGNGTLIIDTSTPSTPVPKYRDRGFIEDVVALHVEGRRLGFALREGDRRVEVYDLDHAMARTPCVETTSEGQTSCGVWLGTLKSGGTTVSAVYLAGAGEQLVVADGLGFRVFVVTDPASPILVSQGTFSPALSMPAMEARPLTAWTHAGKLWVAAASKHNTAPNRRVRIYDTRIDDPNCAATPPCAAALVKTIDVTASPALPSRLSSSVDGGTPFLSVGTDQLHLSGPQSEFLYDVAQPTAPVDLTPKVDPDGYWGWYYEGNPTGFSRVAPYAGVVADGFLYRAASTLLDVHELLGENPPIADFTLPKGTVFYGDQVTALDQSGRRPDSWSWDLDGDGHEDSTEPSPTWTVPPCSSGIHPCDQTVTLTVSNAFGSHTASKKMTVYDPDNEPMVISGFDIQCNSLYCEGTAGDPVTFTLEYGGRPEAFDYDWDGNGSFEDAGNTAPKSSHVYLYGGEYRPQVRVRRGSDQAISPASPTTIWVTGPSAPSPEIFTDDFESGGLDAW